MSHNYQLTNHSIYVSQLPTNKSPYPSMSHNYQLTNHSIYVSQLPTNHSMSHNYQLTNHSIYVSQLPTNKSPYPSMSHNYQLTNHSIYVSQLPTNHSIYVSQSPPLLLYLLPTPTFSPEAGSTRCFWCTGVGDDRSCQQNPGAVHSGPGYVDCWTSHCVTTKVIEAGR